MLGVLKEVSINITTEYIGFLGRMFGELKRIMLIEKNNVSLTEWMLQYDVREPINFAWIENEREGLKEWFVFSYTV